MTSRDSPGHRCVRPLTACFLVSQLGEVMVSMASNLMLADERVLWMAQREALACSRIITCLQKISASRLATPQAFSLVSPVSDSLSPVFTAVSQQLGILPHTVTKTSCKARINMVLHCKLCPLSILSYTSSS